MEIYVDDKRVLKKYSLGMKQRIIFAQAIMEKPDILLLDEPTNALDEEGVNTIRQLVREDFIMSEKSNERIAKMNEKLLKEYAYK